MSPGLAQTNPGGENMIRAASLAVALLALSACASTSIAQAPAAPAPVAAPPTPAPAPPPEPAYPALLLNDQFIGAPPPLRSAGQQWDAAQERSQESAERVAQASLDQGVNQRPDMFQAFQPVLGAEFTAARLPATAALITLVGARLSATTSPAKELYGRNRPFASDPSYYRCTPPLNEQTRNALGLNRSYPSGHSALGFATGLLLTELMPERTQALMERGFQYGRSRVVCGVHWTSDVEAGRVLAAGVVAQAHGTRAFQTQLAAAREELRAAGYIQ
jgi:acid phosphatase (class A)